MVKRRLPLLFLMVALVLLILGIGGAAAASFQSQLIQHHIPVQILKPESYITIIVNYTHDWIAGETDPGGFVTAYVTDTVGNLKGDATVSVSPSGEFFIHCDDWFSGNCVDIQPGDIVQVVGNADGEINPVGSITGLINADQDEVTGYLDVAGYTGTLHLACYVVGDPGSQPVEREVSADHGNYTCDFSEVGWDLNRGDEIWVEYSETDGDRVIVNIPWPWFRVNYTQDWVGGNYELGHTIWFTTTDSIGAVKATGSAVTTAEGGWTGEGFQSLNWHPERPDILPGDFVHFLTDEGITTTMIVGLVNGQVDLPGNSVGGTILAPFPSETLDVKCHPWGAWDAGLSDAGVQHSSAAANGTSPYHCEWDPDTEWDIQANQVIGVMYVEPDGDRVIAEFRRLEIFIPLILK